MNNKTIKAAIVGTGFIGRQHYEAIRRLPNTEIIAIVESNPDTAKSFANTYGIKNYMTNYEDLFKLEDLDVVHICTPNALHFPMAKLALENNVNVFCEKPLSLTAEESRILVDIAKDKDVFHAVNLNYRSNVMVREMKARISNKSIGDVLMVKGEYIQDWLMYQTDYDWHFDPKLVGASRTVADIGTHLFDLVQFITGKDIVSIYANLITVYPTRIKREQTGTTFAQTYTGKAENVEVVNEDAAMIIAKLSDGTYVSMNLSQVTGGYKNGISLVISGSKESLTWNQETSDKLMIGKRDTGNEILYADQKYVEKDLSRFINLPNGHAVGWADAFKNSLGEFYLRLNGTVDNSDSYVDFEKGHQLMKLVEASVLSSKENRWVDL
ncbi:MAG: Gfo/Idh/MocA family oxidoreductase [Erysipelothrix sp.]|nr:Gfo/Idh/MocA family oxidoreductase [Erysipelothrix sp.]